MWRRVDGWCSFIGLMCMKAQRAFLSAVPVWECAHLKQQRDSGASVAFQAQQKTHLRGPFKPEKRPDNPVQLCGASINADILTLCAQAPLENAAWIWIHLKQREKGAAVQRDSQRDTLRMACVSWVSNTLECGDWKEFWQWNYNYWQIG